jgi:hypothetical protein
MEPDANARAFDGPIPGENFTSDTKNYPWHRPPEITDLDEAIEASFKKMTDDDNAVGLLTMMEVGVPIVQIADMFATSGIAAGKWTPDFALLLAGPLCHILYLMAKGYGVDCELGLEKTTKPLTKSFLEGAKRIDAKRAAKAMDEIDLETVISNAESSSPAAPPAPMGGGFAGMAGAPVANEAEMLGGVPEEGI